MAKILILDSEISPAIAYSWAQRMWETSLIEIIEPPKIISFSAKWLKGKHITKGLPDYKGYKKDIIDDKELVKDVWKLIDEADIVVGQNIRAFDIKLFNTRLLAHRLAPPSPYKTVDTVIEYRKYTKLPSNKLDYIGDYFKIGRKLEHEGFGLWKKVRAGDKGAWKRMLRYNKQDVLLTEQIYLLLLPFMSSHPNVDIERPGCPKCSSDDIQLRGFYTTKSCKYRRGQCISCGGWFRLPGNLNKTKSLTSI